MFSNLKTYRAIGLLFYPSKISILIGNEVANIQASVIPEFPERKYPGSIQAYCTPHWIPDKLLRNFPG